MNEKERLIKELRMPQYFKIADSILSPLMFIIGACTKDSLQETHGRHCINIDPKIINTSLCIEIEGDSVSRVKKFWNGIHHITILGGWKNYILIENLEKSDYRFIGWKGENFCQIQRLPIYDQYIKVLKGPNGTKTQFFAFNKELNQTKINIIDEGSMGDMKYPKIRLF